ncbi:hypothetical protein [Collimonas antrihumi]|uniref:hypothetical protein n=1 Tax=Collimonas antrihumi TaxID=1940615 RepID=UPI001B8BF587|nr:hypothetical protein [Collimonas antrihumi]
MTLPAGTIDADAFAIPAHQHHSINKIIDTVVDDNASLCAVLRSSERRGGFKVKTFSENEMHTGANAYQKILCKSFR